ncbi:MAG: helix-turn-helix transcriptional regulator [Candidatus Levyibacteriota bacterium]
MKDNKVGKSLRKARKSLGLTQAQVAEKVGISSNYYSMIERGERENPGSSIMTKIAKVLKLKSSDIFTF